MLEKSVPIGVRSLDPEISRQERVILAAGESLTLDRGRFAGLLQGSGEVTMAVGPLAQFDVPGLLTSLDRYPYGCTEQVTSVAMPLLHLGEVAVAMDMTGPNGIQDRIDNAVTRVLARQGSNGAFGLWRPASGDLWLDAYVTDFLGQARDAGYQVPDLAYAMALDNLRNQVAYARDFEEGGQDLAYALMVLARQGLAAIGDLRYYADAKARDIATPLAKAQLGAALAMYGESRRADAMFRLAAEQIRATRAREQLVYRSDYGTSRRDAAAVLALAVEHGSTAVDRDELTAWLLDPRRQSRWLSSQEQAWTLMAAAALLEDASAAGITVNGAPLDGAAVRRFPAGEVLRQPVEIANTGAEQVEITLTTIGTPTTPQPAEGNGYVIERTYYSLDGERVTPEAVTQNTRMVVVLTITDQTGRNARLMVDDPLPAGFEIDNPNILQAGSIKALDWINTTYPEHAEFRTERFRAAVDWYGSSSFQLAYIVRATSPGVFHHPAALVEDMYRPEFRARTAAGTVEVLGPQR